MNNKVTKKRKGLNREVGFNETFTADSVTIVEPGNFTVLNRKQVEGWLDGMNAAKRLTDEAACREAVARTIVGHIRNRDRLPRRLVGAQLKAAVVLFFAFASLSLCCSNLVAAEIQPGYNFADVSQLYASQLNDLVQNATIQPPFYLDHEAAPVLGGGYEFLLLNPANSTFYTISAQTLLYGNTNLFLDAYQSGPGPSANSMILFYNPSNTPGYQFCSTTVSNLLWNSASNIDVAGLSFANTNNPAGTMQFVLPRWPYPLSGLNPDWTNYPAHFIVFDTNGIPYREGFSNLEANMAFDLGNDFAIPYEVQQEFSPWQIYGTNSAFPYTNAFGWSTNFPITAYIQTNISGTNLPTLTDNDTIPINSTQQGVVGGGPTNTSASLYSIYQYLTNKNTLPPYTMARAQFSGSYRTAVYPGGTASITNMDTYTGIITNIPDAVNWTTPTAVSFQGITSASQIPTTPTVTSNMLYWAYQTNYPNLAFQLFTNYYDALARTNPILGGNSSLGAVRPQVGYEGTLLWLTNYTSVNCAVIQACDGAIPQPGVYDCFFTTPAPPQSPYYYLTGSSIPTSYNYPTSLGIVNFPSCIPPGWTSVYNTNGFELQAMENNAETAPARVHILVQPQ